MTMDSIIDQNHNKVNKNLENIFDISHNPFFVKKISLLLLRKNRMIFHAIILMFIIILQDLNYFIHIIENICLTYTFLCAN